MPREWRGIDDGATNVGADGLDDATGVSFAVEGELRRRAGLAPFANVAARSLGHLRSSAASSWVVAGSAAGAVTGVRMSDASTVALASGYNAEVPFNTAVVGPRIYLTNDFDRVKVWDGVWSAARDAGIAAPTGSMGAPTTSSGSVTVGTHLLRYRYVDSTSPGGVYRSDPSGVLTQSVASSASGQLTFAIGTSATAILRSSDPKVDTIVVEMTAASGSTYYVAATAANSASSVTVNLSDATLVVQDPASTYDDDGHEQPPLCAAMFECRNVVFACGIIPRTRTVTVTNASTSVTGTAFSTLWAGRIVRFGSDTRFYTIASATTTALTLSEAYAGSTGSVPATITSATPNRVAWSKEGFPESWKLLERARDVLQGSGDRIVGGADFLGDAILFGQRSMARLVFVDDPALGEVVLMPGTLGLWNQRCLAAVDGLLYGWGPGGAWVLTGGRARWISRAVDVTVAAQIDRTRSESFHAQVDPAQRTIRWVYVAQGETTPRHAITLDLNQQRWTAGQCYRQGIYAAALSSSDDGELLPVVAASDQTRLWYHEGATDGVPAGFGAASSGSYAAAGGGTTTSTTVTSSLPTGTLTDLTATMLYRPATGETVAISANTADTITHAAFSTAVAAGEVLYVGAIPWSVTTDWWTGDNLADKKRARLSLAFVPDADAQVRVYVYRDYQDTPVTWTANASDRWPSGVSLSNSRNYLVVDCDGGESGDGFVSLPMPAEWSRALKARVECLSPAGTLRVLDIAFGIEGRRDQNQETQE